jgi:hypothetical protein
LGQRTIALPFDRKELDVSEHDQTDEPRETDEDVQDLDVPEGQTDDVTGGKKSPFRTDEKPMK